MTKATRRHEAGGAPTLLSVAAALVLSALTALTLLPGHTTDARQIGSDACPSGHSCGLASALPKQQATAGDELTAKHAPVVYLKEQSESCDPKGEAYYPVAVEAVLGNPDVTLFDDDAVVTTAPTAGDLFEQGETDYLDLPGNPKRPECDYEEAFKALSPPPVVYAHITREAGHDELVLQYWLYFYFNDWNNNHESDWEFVQLVFEAASPEDAMLSEPDRVIYSQHGGGETADWSSSKLRKEGDRPVVYVAKGSHALQYAAENHLGKGADGTGFGCDNATGPSYRADPEPRLIPETIDADSEFAWVTYTGRWGERQSGEFNGPTGPNTKKPWTQPLTWMDKQRDSSVEVPQDSIGPNAAETFCGIVAFGSRLLFGGGPYLVLALLSGIVGSVTITVRQTRFHPVVTRPLAKRRQFGQILRAAFRLERQQWRLFFGIGLLFVPIGVATAGFQALIMSNPPVEPVVDMLDTPLSGAIIAMMIGAVQFGLTYWLVVSATIAAIGEMEEGRTASVAGSYMLVWRNIVQLVLARARALLVIIALAVTLIGIPLAMFYATRWGFLEQAVLLEGERASGARKLSTRLVAGQVPRTFGSITTISLTGIAIGPVIGASLVLLTSASLVYVNVVSSVLYLALIPFVGIALTLLYYDLKVTDGEDAAKA